jgi:hypothetical protein
VAGHLTGALTELFGSVALEIVALLIFRPWSAPGACCSPAAKAPRPTPKPSARS